MKIKQFDIWLANLNPPKGTEVGKVRPVVVVQTDYLNETHPSTVVCPITSNIKVELKLLRVHLKKELDKPSDILVEQIRTIDNKRFLQKIGQLSKEQRTTLKANLRIVLDL
jgi:mRNA interferase MazF